MAATLSLAASLSHVATYTSSRVYHFCLSPCKDCYILSLRLREFCLIHVSSKPSSPSFGHKSAAWPSFGNIHHINFSSVPFSTGYYFLYRMSRHLSVIITSGCSLLFLSGPLRFRSELAAGTAVVEDSSKCPKDRSATIRAVSTQTSSTQDMVRTWADSSAIRAYHLHTFDHTARVVLARR